MSVSCAQKRENKQKCRRFSLCVVLVPRRAARGCCQFLIINLLLFNNTNVKIIEDDDAVRFKRDHSERSDAPSNGNSSSNSSNHHYYYLLQEQPAMPFDLYFFVMPRTCHRPRRVSSYYVHCTTTVYYYNATTAYKNSNYYYITTTTYIHTYYSCVEATCCGNYYRVFLV